MAEPRVIGRYEILLPIAKGGMGAVYLARVRGMGGFVREVALKVVHERGDDEREIAQAELLEEAKIAARLRHPNVVPVIDVGEESGRAFIVMDYVEGDSLSGLVRAAPRVIKEPLPIAIGLRIVLDSLAGLHAAHELTGEDGVPLALVHRDYSPQNILVGNDGIARLTDFGVAKIAARTTNATQSGVVKGKIRYLSPEQARGGELDRRCDIWSAGVVLWELFARRKLWVADTDANVLLKIVTETAPLLSEIVPDIPRAFEAIVAKALQPRRENRFESALALRQELSRAVKDAGLIADHDEVASFVARIAGPTISERRAKIPLSAPSSGRSLERPMTPSSVSATELFPLPPAKAESDTTSAAASLVTPEPPPPPLPRPPAKSPLATIVVVAACTGMVLAGSGLIVFSLTRGGGKAAATATLATSASTTIATPEPASPEAAPTPDPAPGKKTRAVTFTANFDVKVLRYGEHSVSVSPPRSVVALTIPEGEDLRIEAVSTDGRKASAQLDKVGTVVSLAFPARTAPATTPDDLAPSPYKKKP